MDLVAPGWGNLFGELVGHVIPNLREDRLAEFVTRLAGRVRLNHEGLGHLTDRLKNVEGNVEKLALLEEGIRSAVTATDAKRIALIAELVGKGLSASEREAAQSRSILRLLGELDELDVETLTAVATRCAQGRRRVSLDGATEPMLIDDRSDPVKFAAHLMTKGRLESRLLISFAKSGGYQNSYPTTLGELLLERVGLHPDQSKLFHLSGVEPQPTTDEQIPAPPTRDHTSNNSKEPQ